MIKRVRMIGHIKSAADLFLGRARELTMNITDNAIRMHDGATIGGHEMARQDVANVPAATGAIDGKMTASQVGDLSTTKTAVDAHIGAASGHPNATTSDPGFESAADKTKLDGIEDAATVDQSAAEILALLLNVDGSGSGLDADLLDGEEGAFYASDAEVAAALASQLSTLRGELNAPTTTKALFPQEFAPTGWTKDTDQNNKALRIVSGSTGGDAAGATAFSSVFGSGKTAGGTALSIAEMPAHTHDVQTLGGSGALSGVQRATSRDTDLEASAAALTTGGGNSHNHTLSLDIQYVDIIKATKDA